MLEMFSQQGEMVEFDKPVEAKGARPLCHDSKVAAGGGA